MPTPSPRAYALARFAAVPVALLVSGGLVLQASNAAFSATTENAANNWRSGTVVLTDDDNGVAMFTESNLRPGATGENCITVAYTGSLAASVKLYASAVTDGLGANLQVTVEQGTGGSFGSCTGFTGSQIYTGTLGGLPTTYGAGVGTFAPDADPAAGSRAATYRFSYVLDAATPNSEQGKTSTATFTWEAQDRA